MAQPLTLTLAGKPLTFTPTAATARALAASRRKNRKNKGRAARQAYAAFNLTGEELDRFNQLHNRGFGGKFGHKLAGLAGVGVEDQNTHIRFPQVDGLNRDFDWDEPDTERPGSGFTYLNITGPTERVDEESDEPFEDEETVRLHMTAEDMDEMGRVLSAALLRQQLLMHPLSPDDPRALYLEALLDLQDPGVLNFDGDTNPWHDDQHLEFNYHPDEQTWQVYAVDDYGDYVDMMLSTAEMVALHAQFMRRVGTGPQPADAAPDRMERKTIAHRTAVATAPGP